MKEDTRKTSKHGKPRNKLKDYRILEGLHLRERKLRQSVLEIPFFLK